MYTVKNSLWIEEMSTVKIMDEGNENYTLKMYGLRQCLVSKSLDTGSVHS
jgi:hypothetical protein